MNLLSLAPDIQEAILFVKPTTDGRDRISERSLRSLVAAVEWQTQHQLWASLIAGEN